MKFLRLLLIICFIYYIKGSDQEIYCSQTSYYDTEKNKEVELSHKSADDCKDRLSKSEKKSEDKCCYFYGSKQKEKGYCRTLDKYEYANIGKYMKIIELQNEIYKDAPKDDEDDNEDIGDIHIDCYSKYIKLSLIGLVLNFL